VNIVNKLTIRHLKLNKRRTLVTVIGVIISVAMITAVATISASFMDLFQRQTIASDGEWHVQYSAVNAQQIKSLSQDQETKALVLRRDRGYALLEEGQNKFKPYVFIREYNTAGFNQFPIELSEGHLPQAANEIVLSEEMRETAKLQFKLGESLTLDIGQRHHLGEEVQDEAFGQFDGLLSQDGVRIEGIEPVETRSYTIVGFIKRPVWEPTWAPGYTALSYVDEDLLGEKDRVQAMVVLKKVKRSLYAHAVEVAEAIGFDADSVSYNNNLLRYYAVTNNNQASNMLVSLAAIIMSLIMVGSVSLIYNAFAISVSERARHLGMLSSIGATSRQKRNSVFFEGAVIGVVSIPLGIISGYAGIGITFLLINSAIKGALGITESLTVAVTPMTIIVACAVSILTIFISCYVPARRASRISAIDAIRQSTDIKLTSKAVKTSKLVRSLFGFEAEIGLKNLKRNKRRYQATVFSLVISIVLFLTVSYFTDTLKKAAELSQDGVTFDIQIGVDGEEFDPDYVNKVHALEELTDYNAVKQLILYAWIDEDRAAAPLLELAKQEPDMIKDGKIRYYIQLYGLDDRSLKDYASKVGADYDRLAASDQMNAIVVDQIVYPDREANKYVETKAIRTALGERIPLLSENVESGVETQIESVEVAALTDELPLGLFHAGIGGISVIVSEEVVKGLMNTDTSEDINYTSSLYLTSSDPMKTQRTLEGINEVNYNIMNVYKYKQQEEQLILLISVFTYGFIVLITAISVANILNTITTSISLRKREFAMLKSVGMTPKGFNKMINYESIFYGIKSLLYGLPLSLMIMFLIYRSIMNSFSFSFELPWTHMLIAVIAVFAIVGLAMMYSITRVKRDNIIDAIKQESI
jgi:putative ABC transport system permease protein